MLALNGHDAWRCGETHARFIPRIPSTNDVKTNIDVEGSIFVTGGWGGENHLVRCRGGSGREPRYDCTLARGALRSCRASLARAPIASLPSQPPSGILHAGNMCAALEVGVGGELVTQETGEFPFSHLAPQVRHRPIAG